MTISEAGLKSAIIGQMQAKGFNPTNTETNGEGEKYIEALATAIVQYIKTNADVVVAGGSSSGTYKIT